METLVLAQHRNQYYSRSKSQISDQFASSSTNGFRDINCRTFQSGAGILPSPYSLPSPVAKKASVSPPKTLQLVAAFCENENHLKINKRSNSIPINVKRPENGSSFNDEDSYSELWAGPTYSNSPPPSSLPIPKFSLRQKRSVSLDLPTLDSGVKIQVLAKSAPPSPTRESYSSANNFFLNTASATANLRRILHLDVSDE